MKYFLAERKREITNAAAEILGIDASDVAVEHANPKFGADLAVPVFKFAGQKKMSPQDIAQKLAEELRLDGVAKTEALGGFVNVWLDDSALAKGVFADWRAARHDDRPYGTAGQLSGSQVVVEYTDPNPFKEFHIGHAYSNTVGESFSRLLESAGAEVHRVSYHGDVGMQIAKAIWGMRSLLAETNVKPELESVPEDERPEFLGRAYARGAKAFEEDTLAAEEITRLNKQIYTLYKENAESDAELRAMYETGRQWSFDYFERIYERLGVGFEKKYMESQAAEAAQPIIEEGLDSGVFEESDGAVVFRGEEHGLHTRVFVNSQGLPTYEAKDLGLAMLKQQDYHYDRSIIITGNEQNQYFQVLLAALGRLRPEQAERSQQIGHGMVRLASGKMSSRTGDVITAVWLLDEVERRILERAPESPAVKENTLGAIKYAFLMHNVGEDIVFDLEESISLEGRSGPYVQYAAVRVSSILNKLQTQGDEAADYDWEAERELLLRLAKYPEVVSEAVQKLAPQDIAQYVYDLARECNRYYENVSVMNSEPEQQKARVAMLEVLHDVYEHALYLLGIDTPERM